MGNQISENPNSKLGFPIVEKIEGFSSIPAAEKSKVVACYLLLPDNTIENSYAKLFHAIIVATQGVEMYCLLTGGKRKPSYYPLKGGSIVSSVYSQNHIKDFYIILAELYEGFVILEAYTLVITQRFGLSCPLPNLIPTKKSISTMVSPAPEIVYVGYLSGIVKVWHTAAEGPQYTFGKENELPSVRCLCYSHKHRVLIVGYEDYYENQEGRFIKTEKNFLRVYVPNAVEEETKCILLEGLTGSPLSIELIERLSLAFAISSEERILYIWSLRTYEQVTKIIIPRIESYPQIMTQLIILEMPQTNYVIFGFKDGIVLISEIQAKGQEITWIPIKKIKIHSDNNCSITYLQYDVKLDTLIIGNSYSTAYLVSNFLLDGLNINLSTTVEEQIDNI